MKFIFISLKAAILGINARIIPVIPDGRKNINKSRFQIIFSFAFDSFPDFFNNLVRIININTKIKETIIIIGNLF